MLNEDRVTQNEKRIRIIDRAISDRLDKFFLPDCDEELTEAKCRKIHEEVHEIAQLWDALDTE